MATQSQKSGMENRAHTTSAHPIFPAGKELVESKMVYSLTGLCLPGCKVIGKTEGGDVDPRRLQKMIYNTPPPRPGDEFKKVEERN